MKRPEMERIRRQSESHLRLPKPKMKPILKMKTVMTIHQSKGTIQHHQLGLSGSFEYELSGKSKPKDSIKTDLIKVQLIGAINPFITECQELTKMLPGRVLKQDYSS